MPQPLPERASLDWLKKTAKQNLRALRAQRPDARLSDAQLALAREHGFPSWRALKAHIDGRSRAAPREEEAAAFLSAVGDGAIETVRTALAARPELVNVVGRHPFWGGRPQPLHVAIETKRREMFDLLLDSGAEVDGRNDAYDHWSPLMLACHRRQPEMVQALVDRGARIGIVEALMMKDDSRLDRRLAEGLPATVPNGGSILAFARTIHAIDRLLECGAPTDTKDRWGTTPVEAMSRLGAEGGALVQHMLALGASASAADYARVGDRARLETLAASDPDRVRSDAVLVAAVESGHHALAKWLLDLGAGPNARADDESRRTALHAAAWRGDLKMVQLLVQAGADLQVRDSEHHDTPLGWAQTSIRVSNNPRCIDVAEFLARRA